LPRNLVAGVAVVADREAEPNDCNLTEVRLRCNQVAANLVAGVAVLLPAFRQAAAVADREAEPTTAT
jgi:hypothetical protein